MCRTCMCTLYFPLQISSPKGDKTSDSESDLPLAQLKAQQQQKRDQSVTKATSPKKPSRRTKKGKRDQEEPQKPVSAYALFFRDTQAVIKVMDRLL